MLGSKKKQLKV
jgi:hypothetical protein